MALLTTIRAVMKDVQMREQADLIQIEVQRMLQDVRRLDTRVGKLQRHFDQANEDLRQIRITTEKVDKRAERIDALQLEDDQAVPDQAVPKQPVPERPAPVRLKAEGD